MAREDPKPPIGAGHAGAMFREGLRELRNALYPESNVAAQNPEHGLFGTRTPGEVAAARKAEDRDLNEEPRSILDERTAQAEQARDVREPEPPQPEKE